MGEMKLETNTDEAGALRIQLPRGSGRRHVHVTLVWDDARPSAGWPEGWFETAAGSIADPTFVRHPQGAYEQRSGLR